MSASEAQSIGEEALAHVPSSFDLLDEKALSKRPEAVFKEIVKDLTPDKQEKLLKAVQPAFKDIQDNIKKQAQRLVNSQGGLNKVPTWVSTKPVMAAADVQAKQLVTLTCQDKGLREHSEKLFADRVMTLAKTNPQLAKLIPQVSSPKLTDVYMNAMQAYYYERVMTGVGFTQTQLKGFYCDNPNNLLVRFDHQNDQATLDSGNVMDGVILGMIVRAENRQDAAETKAENREEAAETKAENLQDAAETKAENREDAAEIQAGMANSKNRPHLAKELLRDKIIEKIDNDTIARVLKKYEPKNSFEHTLAPSLSCQPA